MFYNIDQATYGRSNFYNIDYSSREKETGSKLGPMTQSHFPLAIASQHKQGRAGQAMRTFNMISDGTQLSQANTLPFCCHHCPERGYLYIHLPNII